MIEYRCIRYIKFQTKSLNLRIKCSLPSKLAFANERAYRLFEQRLETFLTGYFVFSNPCPWIFSLQKKSSIPEFDNLTFLSVAQKHPSKIDESLYLAKIQSGEEWIWKSQTRGLEIEIPLRDGLSVGKFLLISNVF